MKINTGMGIFRTEDNKFFPFPFGEYPEGAYDIKSDSVMHDGKWISCTELKAGEK